MKRSYLNSQGYRITLPWGFHIVEDLLSLFQLAADLKKSQLSRAGKRRLAWMDYYRIHKNVSKTCRYFGICRKTFYYWHKRYDPQNLVSLEERSRTPKMKRQRQITSIQEARLVTLRKKYIRYGKEKIARIYTRLYGETISAWKAQKVIEKYKLYFHPQKTAKIARKRRLALKKKRITELKKKPRTGFLLCLDVIVIYWVLHPIY